MFVLFVSNETNMTNTGIANLINVFRIFLTELSSKIPTFSAKLNFQRKHYSHFQKPNEEKKNKKIDAAAFKEGDVSQKEFYLCKFAGVKGERKLWRGLWGYENQFSKTRGILLVYKCSILQHIERLTARTF